MVHCFFVIIYTGVYKYAKLEVNVHKPALRHCKLTSHFVHVRHNIKEKENPHITFRGER